MNKERAYKILNLEDKSRNDGSVITSRDVEKSYRELLHSRHPDKGGTKEEFLQLQSARRTALGEQEHLGPSSRGRSGENHHHHLAEVVLRIIIIIIIIIDTLSLQRRSRST